MESKAIKPKNDQKEAFNVEDQIASMLVNVMDDSDDSEKDNSESEEIQTNQKNIMKYLSNDKPKKEQNFNTIESKKVFKGESSFNKFIFNNDSNDTNDTIFNSNSSNFFSSDLFNQKVNKKDKKFESNNYLDRYSFDKSFEPKASYFNHNSIRMLKRSIPQQPKIFFNNVQFNYNQNKNGNFTDSNSENDFNPKQNYMFSHKNHLANNNIDLKCINNFNNNFNNSSSNLNNLNNNCIHNKINNKNNNIYLVANEQIKIKSQSAKNSNLIYYPLNISSRLMNSNNNIYFNNNNKNIYNNNGNIRFYSNNNLPMNNINNNNNYNNNNISNNNTTNMAHNFNKLLNVKNKPFYQNNYNNNVFNLNLNRGSNSTNVTNSRYSVSSSFNEQITLVIKTDEFQSNCKNQIKIFLIMF